MARGKSKIISIVSWVIVILVLLGGIGALVYLTNGFKDVDPNAYRLEIDGKTYKGDMGGAVFNPDEQIKVEIKSLSTVIDKDAKIAYDVKVLPIVTADNDFEFSLDGQPYYWSGEVGKDYRDAFTVSKYETHFSFGSEYTTVAEVLARIYPDKQLVCPDRYLSLSEYLCIEVKVEGKLVANVAFKMFVPVGSVLLSANDLEIG